MGGLSVWRRRVLVENTDDITAVRRYDGTCRYDPEVCHLMVVDTTDVYSTDAGGNDTHIGACESSISSPILQTMCVAGVPKMIGYTVDRYGFRTNYLMSISIDSYYDISK